MNATHEPVVYDPSQPQGGRTPVPKSLYEAQYLRYEIVDKPDWMIESDRVVIEKKAAEKGTTPWEPDHLQWVFYYRFMDHEGQVRYIREWVSRTKTFDYRSKAASRVAAMLNTSPDKLPRFILDDLDGSPLRLMVEPSKDGKYDRITDAAPTLARTNVWTDIPIETPSARVMTAPTDEHANGPGRISYQHPAAVAPTVEVRTEEGTWQAQPAAQPKQSPKERFEAACKAMNVEGDDNVLDLIEGLVGTRAAFDDLPSGKRLGLVLKVEELASNDLEF